MSAVRVRPLSALRTIHQRRCRHRKTHEAFALDRHHPCRAAEAAQQLARAAMRRRLPLGRRHAVTARAAIQPARLRTTSRRLLAAASAVRYGRGRRGLPICRSRFSAASAHRDRGRSSQVQLVAAAVLREQLEQPVIANAKALPAKCVPLPKRSRARSAATARAI